MRIKWSGETQLKLGELADVQGKLRRDRPSPAPLPTGWRALDVATQIGGFPRKQMVVLTGQTEEQARDFVLTLIANLQDGSGPPVAVVDMAEDFAQKKVRHTDVDYEKLTVVRTGKLDEGIEAARALLARADHEAVLLHFPKLVKGAETSEWMKLVSEAVRRSPTAGLVNLGHTPQAALNSAFNLWVYGGDKVRLSGEHDAEVELPADEQGRPSKVADLVEGALTANLIERSGSTYRLSGHTVRGRSSLVRLLSTDVGLETSLESQLDERTRQLRRNATSRPTVQYVTSGVVAGSIGDRIRMSEDPKLPVFAVNTWFEADVGVRMPLAPGRPYEFNIRIGRSEDHAAGQSSQLETLPDFGEHESVDLMATVHSRDFAVAIQNRRFRLYKTTGSDLVTFAVVPRRAGDCTLRLTISTERELEILHKVEVTVPTEAEETG